MRWFDIAVDAVLRHEGGLVDHPQDPGGITHFGISLRFARTLGLRLDLDGDGDVDADDIRKLPRSEAVALYHDEWWARHRIGERLRDQATATKMLDLAVNTGWARAVTLLQRALRACGEFTADDGIFGPGTQAAVDVTPPALVLPALRSEAAGFYRQLAAQDPGQFAWALKGWLNRAYD